jgi:acetolactate synthase I/II/III large subunit
MNVSDQVMVHLAARGVTDVFAISGGGVMYLVDALGQNEDLRFWCDYHEQACAIAAESYARLTGRVGVCLVTSGPGAANAISGLAGAWMDSTPVLAIAGQVRSQLIADYARFRQLGPQEMDAVSMARPVTKFATSLTRPEDTAAVLDEALAAATSGRPGPVLVELPLDVQGAPADEAGMRRSRDPLPQPDPLACDAAELEQVIHALASARRPVVVCGKGVRLAGAAAAFDETIRELRIPVVATIGGHDVLPEDHPYCFGRFGPTGQRRANFLIQNADLLLCVGSGMSVAAIGFDTSTFAPGATRIVVNVDPGELGKPNFAPDIAVHCDLRPFLRSLRRDAGATGPSSPERKTWLEACRDWKARYPLLEPQHEERTGYVNSYYFAHALSQHLGPDDVVVTGNSLDAHSIFHSFAVRSGQHVYTNTNFGAMGWDLPALVGACVAHAGRVVLVTGDGSIQFNVQELLTIGRHKLQAHIFVINNGGYQAIRTTQRSFCDGRLVACDAGSGVFNPSFEHLAAAYGLEYARLATNADIDASLADVLAMRGPVLCELNVSYEQERTPRVQSRREADGTIRSGRLQDQYPYLSPDEVQANMRVSHLPDATK